MTARHPHRQLMTLSRRCPGDKIREKGDSLCVAALLGSGEPKNGNECKERPQRDEDRIRRQERCRRQRRTQRYSKTQHDRRFARPQHSLDCTPRAMLSLVDNPGLTPIVEEAERRLRCVIESLA